MRRTGSFHRRSCQKSCIGPPGTGPEARRPGLRRVMAPRPRRELSHSESAKAAIALDLENGASLRVYDLDLFPVFCVEADMKARIVSRSVILDEDPRNGEGYPLFLRPACRSGGIPVEPPWVPEKVTIQVCVYVSSFGSSCWFIRVRKPPDIRTSGRVIVGARRSRRSAKGSTLLIQERERFIVVPQTAPAPRG